MNIQGFESSGRVDQPQPVTSQHEQTAHQSLTAQADDYTLYVPQMFAMQARLTPDAAAVVAGNKVTAYGELDAQSNRIAHYLRSVGAGPGALVSLRVTRSATLAAAALGVMKAGSAYVPFDTAHPPGRVLSMMQDARPAVLIAEAGFDEHLHDGGWHTLVLDQDAKRVSSFSADPLVPAISSSDLAYVIYTSGSTGRPKGVEVTHGALLNLVLWHQHAFGVSPADRASLIASPAFDASVWEMWPYLSAGASLHVPDQDIRTDAASLQMWLLAQRVTITFQPTLLAERLITLDWPRQTSLRVMLTGADTLRKFPSPNLPFTFVNNYGPTECTVVTTSGVVSPSCNGGEVPTIGKPISNVQVHILDSTLQPVPHGVAGEICISGRGLARGYLNDPELTSAKFIPGRFSSETPVRLYRTGDLGRYLPDGQIAFLGRMDDQLKIRGFRIEPNEIVAVLGQHPAVRESAVVARESTSETKSLVAYIVKKPGTHLTSDDLTAFLEARLPSHMIPSTFVSMEALPLNFSGKVDRTALPLPDDSNILSRNKIVAPRTRIEQRIADILAPLLGISKIGVDDNFFMLGGHSLLGTQLIARTREAFGIELSLRSLFESPTIASLAAEVERLLYARLDAMSEEDAERFLKSTAQ